MVSFHSVTSNIPNSAKRSQRHLFPALGFGGGAKQSSANFHTIYQCMGGVEPVSTPPKLANADVSAFFQNVIFLNQI
jgi:hypothetical protein